MMKKLHIFGLLLFVIISGTNSAYSQADTIIKVCSQHINSPYISDGQQYKTLLNNDEVAEFHTTFFGGSTYRIIGCSGLSQGNLIITLYDRERNVLFTNKEYSNAPYWDFKFEHTIDCIIEAQLDSKNLSSGFAIIMIAFKQ